MYKYIYIYYKYIHSSDKRSIDVEIEWRVCRLLLLPYCNRLK